MDIGKREKEVWRESVADVGVEAKQDMLTPLAYICFFSEVATRNTADREWSVRACAHVIAIEVSHVQVA